MNPSVVVLEGPNGAGKTLLAKMLWRGIPNAVVYRPFAVARYGPHGTLRLREAGVPLNTHVDDLYAADAIRELVNAGRTVILDRSFPSGLAYALARLREQHFDIGNTQTIQAVENCVAMAPSNRLWTWLELWEEILGPRKLYVTMLVDYDTATKRTADRGRWAPTREIHDQLVQRFVQIHERAREPKLLMDTAGLESSVERCVSLILHNLKRLG